MNKFFGPRFQAAVTVATLLGVAFLVVAFVMALAQPGVASANRSADVTVFPETGTPGGGGVGTGTPGANRTGTPGGGGVGTGTPGAGGAGTGTPGAGGAGTGTPGAGGAGTGTATSGAGGGGTRTATSGAGGGGGGGGGTATPGTVPTTGAAAVDQSATLGILAFVGLGFLALGLALRFFSTKH